MNNNNNNDNNDDKNDDNNSNSNSNNSTNSVRVGQDAVQTSGEREGGEGKRGNELSSSF